MNEYKKFSYYYDELMQTLDYELWFEFITPYLKKETKLLDLACGTGSFLMLAYNNGISCYGLDLSETAIEIAKEKAKINHFNINYKVSDMTNFSYDTKFDIITCFFDSINFLDSKGKINKLLNNVYKYLKDDGYFIFDIFSKYMFNEYVKNSLINDYDTFKINWQTKKIDSKTLFHDIYIYEDDNTYHETYKEYYYDFNDFDFSNFKIIKIVVDFNDDLQDEDERIIFVLQKKGLI